MLKLTLEQILVELGAEPLDGSGFESEQAETQDEHTSADLEVAE